MLSIFEPCYVPPYRRTIATYNIPALYDDVRENIAKQMTILVLPVISGHHELNKAT